DRWLRSVLVLGLLVGLSLGVIPAAPVGWAATRCVSAATPTPPGCFPTIQAAVAAAASGDTISIHAGTYAEHVTISPATTAPAALALAGAGAGSRFVDGASTGRVVTIGGTVGVTLTALTLQHGRGAAGSGATPGAAGGLQVNGGTVAVQQATFSANVGGAGSGAGSGGGAGGGAGGGGAGAGPGGAVSGNTRGAGRQARRGGPPPRRRRP